MYLIKWSVLSVLFITLAAWVVSLFVPEFKPAFDQYIGLILNIWNALVRLICGVPTGHDVGIVLALGAFVLFFIVFMRKAVK